MNGSMTLRKLGTAGVLAACCALVACSSSAGKAAKGATSPSVSSASSAAGAGALPASRANAPSNTVWLCEPDAANDPCTSPLTTMVTATSGATHMLDLRPAKEPPIDCFYVYPTVSTQKGPNADLTIDPDEIAIAELQAAQFSRDCRVFAPMYPQATLSAILSPVGHSPAVIAKAYQGVLDAWNDYLAHDNHGRGVVLIGHSQGTGTLIQLLRKQIDPSPAERALLVSAILIGGNVIVPAGKDVGGDFAHIPACTATSQTGCVIAFSTYDKTPPADTIFGKPNPIQSGPAAKVADPEVLCTNPAALGGGRGPLRSMFPPSMFRTTSGEGLLGDLLPAMFAGKPPRASTPWVEWEGWYTATCSNAGGANVLRVSPVGPAPTLVPEPSASWGLHLIDVNLALGNLVAIVADQAAAYHR